MSNIASLLGFTLWLLITLLLAISFLGMTVIWAVDADDHWFELGKKLADGVVK